ncbi:SDR family NAD(P)-dependent oxidoreductase [Parasphingorhabdus cellanae]|uniref:SDR family oxidoreductase n=1 Tax=Parasphingorhabdus cellanae TaxID=2806553 RepID=A0ABX7T9N9_9SPHN|nr:SDR family oxidoreductase [Parasphingorhabdus cellanae]QTD57269.1 SDR family oxidoreductase [Parasphingorhabdus cellanae]
MDLQLRDRIVFIGGGSRGIGLGIAETCLEEDAKVAIAARGEERLEEERKRLASIYGEDRIWSRAGDLTDPETINATVNEIESDFGPIWAAVANVGLHPTPPGYDLEDDVWRAGFNQNLDSAYMLSRAVLQRLEKRGEGSLLLISSIAGMAALGTPLTYGTAKAAMNHLAKELAGIMGSKGIRINALAPGNVIFPGGDWERRKNGERGDAWIRWIKREVALQRFGTPDEIGSAAAYMISPLASFMTGAIVPVDGGQSK